jgi:hypothetical protein
MNVTAFCHDDRNDLTATFRWYGEPGKSIVINPTGSKYSADEIVLYLNNIDNVRRFVVELNQLVADFDADDEQSQINLRFPVEDAIVEAEAC